MVIQKVLLVDRAGYTILFGDGFILTGIHTGRFGTITAEEGISNCFKAVKEFENHAKK